MTAAPGRRRFLQSAATALAGLALAARAPHLRAAHSWKTEFDAALAERPWLLGYATASAESFDSAATLRGDWPQGLRGTLYRNGPARHEIGPFRYHHWFDGDGMLQAYRLAPDAVHHRARFVQTYKFQAEQRAGRALYPGFASAPPDPAPVTSPDSLNPANISVLHHHGKLLSLWEAGSPWEMDPDDLSTRGAYAFSDHTRGVPFSAHPRVEADGTLWNFGYFSAARLMLLWHIDPNGRLVKIDKIEVDPITMVHDFVVTERHLVILVAPLHHDNPDADNFLDQHTWHADRPTRVLVVDKDDFADRFWLELPAQWVFHYGNGWEDRNGIIHFDAARADDPLAMIDSFREIMRGNVVGQTRSHHHTYRIDTRAKRISEAPMFAPTVDSEFPCVDPRVSCRRNRHITMLSRDGAAAVPHPGLNEVSRLDLETGVRAIYRYPDHQIPEEHLYVPDRALAPETGGWIVGTALDWRAGHHLLNVFDAREVAAGPVATATLPYALPLGLHGKFVHA